MPCGVQFSLFFVTAELPWSCRLRSRSTSLIQQAGRTTTTLHAATLTAAWVFFVLYKENRIRRFTIPLYVKSLSNERNWLVFNGNWRIDSTNKRVLFWKTWTESALLNTTWWQGSRNVNNGWVRFLESSGSINCSDSIKWRKRWVISVIFRRKCYMRMRFLYRLPPR